VSVTAWKLLSVALDYPGEEVLALRSELLAAARALPAGAVRAELVAFCEEFAAADGLELQRRYVETFDFSKRTALNLSFFAHGDRRQRGVALLQLKRLLGALGLEPSGEELPDHLPLLLEVADVAGDEPGRDLLGLHRPAIELIGAALRDSGSAYARLFAALGELLGPPDADQAAEAVRLAAEGPPAEQVGLEPFAPPTVMPEPTTCGVPT
jgi:nitrate reductase delta subunit